jgi:hypothetical protein
MIESYECPVCRGENVELIPLNLSEKYEYQLEPNKGLEIKFSIIEEIRNLETEDSDIKQSIIHHTIALSTNLLRSVFFQMILLNHYYKDQ